MRISYQAIILSILYIPALIHAMDKAVVVHMDDLTKSTPIPTSINFDAIAQLLAQSHAQVTGTPSTDLGKLTDTFKQTLQSQEPAILDDVLKQIGQVSSSTKSTTATIPADELKQLAGIGTSLLISDLNKKGADGKALATALTTAQASLTSTQLDLTNAQTSLASFKKWALGGGITTIVTVAGTIISTYFGAKSTTGSDCPPCSQ